MSYTFDSADGDTFANLQERVTFNSFSSTRYAEFVKRALNDAVTAICRKLGLFETYEVLAYAATTGLVDDPTQAWVRIEEVWSSTATAAAAGEYAFAAAANHPLSRIQAQDLGSMQVGFGPYHYIVRRRKAPASAGFSTKLDVIVAPPSSTAGFVAVKGLQRPAVMDADDDVSGLGAELDMACVAYAKAEAFDNEDDFEAAAIWRSRFDSALREAVEGGNDDDGPDVVEGTWGC